MTNKLRIRKLNAWQIKLIMAFLMLLDHYFPLPSTILVSRCVAPMFAYLAVEGVRHTRDFRRYCLRLSVWAAVMFAGNMALNLLLKRLWPAMQPHDEVWNNIFITLAAGVSCIALILFGKEKAGVSGFAVFGAAILVFAVGFCAEWGIVLLPFMLVTYFLRGRKLLLIMGYILIEVLAILLHSEIW